MNPMAVSIGERPLKRFSPFARWKVFRKTGIISTAMPPVPENIDRQSCSCLKVQGGNQDLL